MFREVGAARDKLLRKRRRGKRRARKLQVRSRRRDGAEEVHATGIVMSPLPGTGGEVGQVWLCAVWCVVVISGPAFSELLAKV